MCKVSKDGWLIVVIEVREIDVNVEDDARAFYHAILSFDPFQGH